jgi:hypothetical protein
MMTAVAPSAKPQIFLGRNIFYNDEYEELAHTEEQVEELEDGRSDDLLESEDLVTRDVMIVGSGIHRKARISRVKRYLRCVLIAACIATIIAVGIVTGRHLSYGKYYGLGGYRVRVDALCSLKAISTAEGLARR